MSTLILIVSPHGPGDGVLDVLQDLSGLGLVDRFFWVAESGLTSTSVPVTAVRDGVRAGTTLQEVLAGTDHARVRVCVLVPLLGGSSTVAAAAEQRLAELVESTSGGARIERIRCILTRPSLAPVGDLAREGWHNLMLAPEESQGPGRGHSLLAASTDPIEIGRHAAPVVAAILGLWTGMSAAPFDDEQALPGQVVREVRSFYRRLDATAVEGELRAQVLATHGGLPLPREHGQVSVFVDDVLLATSTMARALWTKHAEVLQGPRVRPAVQTARSIGAWAAVKMLFGFLAAAIRNAPVQWYAATVNRVSSATAQAVHSAVFGSVPSAYAVAVNGVTSSGLPAGWDELASAAAQLDDALLSPGERREHETSTSLGSLWRDYAVGALSLADGGHRDPALAPVQVGAARGVLREVSDSVPSRAGSFTQLQGYVAAEVGITEVGSVDVLGAHTLRQRLDQLSKEPATALDADRARQALTRWQSERRNSYAVQVGGILGKRLLEVGQEVCQLLTDVAALATNQDVDRAGRAKQRRLALWLKVALGVATAAVVVAVVLGALGVLGWAAVAIIGAFAILTWFVVSLGLFMKQQRALFRELNRRLDATAQADAMRANLRHALRDQRRLASAYRQYLSWSSVLGSVLEAPFGVVAIADPSAGGVGAGLPLTTRLGWAVVDPGAVAEAAGVIRCGVYATGWLSAPFEAAVREAGQRLGPDAQDLRSNAGSIFGLQAGPEQTPLTRWADLLANDGVGTTCGDAVWERVLKDLDGSQRELGVRLVATVRTEGGERSVVDYLDFMAGVDEPDAQRPEQRFDASVLGNGAGSRDRTIVESNWAVAVRRGLGRFAVLTQIGEGIPAYEFDIGGTGPADAASPVVTVTGPAIGREPIALPAESATWVF